MPKDRERRGDDEGADELEQFFAPLDEDWPEEEEPLLPEAPPEGEAETEAETTEPAAETGAEPADLDEWSVQIDVPDEGELLAPEPGEPAADTTTEAEPADAAAEATGEEPDSALFADIEDDVATVPPEEIESATEPPATEAGGEPELIDEEAVRPPADEGAVVPPAVAEETPEPAAVEAAAEHFAEGIREPEQVERELLADLQAEAPPITPEHEAPSWQEAAEPIITEEVATAGPAPARDLRAALVSGALLGIAVIALLAIGKGPFTALVMAVVLLGQAELYAVLRERRLQPATLLGLVCGGLMIAGAYLRGPQAVLFGLVLLMGLTVLWYMAAPQKARKNTAVNAAVTIFGGVYVPFFASFAVLLLTSFPGSLGRNVFLVVIGMTVLYDVSAYAVGTLWGSRPMAATISPQKSWEGAVGATVILLVVALSIVPAIEPFDATRAIGLALVLAVVAPLGDLVESALKRDLRVKDMGSLLPGHGGILDRIDAILFTSPAAYYFLQLSF
ncbi:MAG TPA: phosphatidate cytidylyltransferase [Actinomycetota bacterium]|nr:phosphatidate cytidylyltransferase [Actinomycetota bacterium]